jgi:hypothetical protein
MHSWSIFGAWTSHGQTQTHLIHHSMDLKEATTFPLIVFYVLGHGASTQMSFCIETPKLESKNSLNWDFRNKIRKSIRILTPKVRAHLEVWGFIPSHSLAFPKA